MKYKLTFTIYSLTDTEAQTTHRCFTKQQLKKFRKTKYYKQKIISIKPFKHITITANATIILK